MPVTITSTTFAAAGTYTLTLPSGVDGDYMELIVVANQAAPIAVPAGWTFVRGFRSVAPTQRTFYRDRQSGDASVTFTVTGQGAAMVVGYPVPLAGILDGTAEVPTNPATYNHAGFLGSSLLLVAWSTDSGYIDTAGTFTRHSIASRPSYTLSAYSSDDNAAGTITLQDTVGIFRHLDVNSFDDQPLTWNVGGVGASWS